MPTVAVIDGVRIELYADEHPPPHFHARYAEHVAQIEIGSGRVIKGSLPHPQLRKVLDWACSKTPQLTEAWAALERKQKPGRIA
jgi:hypothetical protein